MNLLRFELLKSENVRQRHSTARVYRCRHSNSPPLAPHSDAPAEALHVAVRAGRLDDVKRLIAAGTPADARDALGSTPLLDAAWSGDIEIARFLLDHGAEVNARHRESGSTPLQYAVLTGRTEMTNSCSRRMLP